MKPIRGKCSLIKISFVTKRVTQVSGRVTLLYRFTAGFRPYILDFKFDGCALMRKETSAWNHKGIMIFVNVIKDVYPSLFTGCPYEGRYDSTPWYDSNASTSQLLPPVVPTGVFRLQLTFEVAPNVNLISYRVDVLIKATREYRATDFSFLNMG